MVDRDHTSIASGSIGAVLGTLIGEPLKAGLGAVGRRIYQFIKDGWELESIVKGVNESDDLRLYQDVINSMEQFSLSSDEYTMLSAYKRDLEKLMIANIRGSRNTTWYTRSMISREIQACKKKVHETDLVAVRALTERAKHHRGHYFVPTVDTSKPIVPRESYISLLRNLLANGPEWILLHGPGGVGKTHLVRYIFHMQEARQLFGCVVYVEVGHGKDEESVVVAIDSQLQMLPRYSPFYKVTNVGELTQSIQSLANRTSKKPMLIILDDVWDRILETVNSLSVRKLVISQKADVLDQFSRDRIAKLEVHPFSHEDGYKLFCLYAFGEEEAPTDINKYVELMVEECDGFPQALEVTGKYMAKDFETLHNLTKWEHVLEKIGRGRCGEKEKVFKVLKISYYRLTHDEKILFLCIAMHNHPAYYIIGDRVSLYYCWLALNCYEHDDYQHSEFLSTWKSLEDASLAKEHYHLSRMMEGLADYIIKEDRHPYFKLQDCHHQTSSRVEAIYGSTGSMKGERVSDILSNDMPRLSVMHLDVKEPMHISLKSCTNLKFLCLQGRFITICGLELLVHLRYLKIAPLRRCWCSIGNILEALKRLHQLEVLQIGTQQSKTSRDRCDGEVALDLRFLENMDRLNHLTIDSKSRSHPLRNLQYIGKLNHLQNFVMRSWSNEHVEADPPEVAWLSTSNQKLQTLNLPTVRFKEMPLEIDFPSLVSLHLNVATKKLPNGFEALHHLKYLTLDGGGTLLKLPRIDKLSKLYMFQLSGFSGEHLLQSFGEAGTFPSLRRLTIANCQQLQELNFQSPVDLVKLDISGCNQLSQIEFKELKTVEDLRILDCNNLVEIHFEELKTVKGLNILDCNNLVELHFQALECIDHRVIIRECNKLMQLDFIERVRLGRTTRISGCNNLERLPPLSHISGELCLMRCNRLVNCPDCHGELRKLVLEDLPSLTEIGYIPSVEKFTLKNLPSLVEVRAVLNLTSRMETDCEGLARFKESLPNLEILHLLGTNSEETASQIKFPDMGIFAGFPKLRDLTVEGFTFKYLPPDITLLTGLKDLTIMDCPQLEALVEDHTQFSSLVNLKRLELYDLPKLTSLPDCVEVLGVSVDIYNCPGLGKY